MNKPDYIIFPDASQRRRDGYKFTSYGCVLVNYKDGTYTTIGDKISNKTIIYAEGYAIFKGLDKLSEIASKKSDVVIVSDSKLNVTVMNKYIPYMWDISDYKNWKKTNGEQVENQELYRKILKIINRKEFRTKFIHINSHLNWKDAGKVKRIFELSQIDITENTAKSFIKLNNLADEIATEITYEMKQKMLKNN